MFLFDTAILAGQLAPSSLQGYQQDLAAYLCFCGGDPATALDPARLARWRTAMAQDTPLAPSTITRRPAAASLPVPTWASVFSSCVTFDLHSSEPGVDEVHPDSVSAHSAANVVRHANRMRIRRIISGMSREPCASSRPGSVHSLHPGGHRDNTPRRRLRLRTHWYSHPRVGGGDGDALRLRRGRRRADSRCAAHVLVGAFQSTFQALDELFLLSRGVAAEQNAVDSVDGRPLQRKAQRADRFFADSLARVAADPGVIGENEGL